MKPMNTSTDPKNPEHCRIRRVENGWILSVGESFGCAPIAEFVFTAPAALADFIGDNFQLLKLGDEQ